MFCLARRMTKPKYMFMYFCGPNCHLCNFYNNFSAILTHTLYPPSLPLPSYFLYLDLHSSSLTLYLLSFHQLQLTLSLSLFSPYMHIPLLVQSPAYHSLLSFIKMFFLNHITNMKYQRDSFPKYNGHYIMEHICAPFLLQKPCT